MKNIFKYIKKLKNILLEDTKWIYVLILGTMFLLVLIILPSSFAVLQPIKTVEIYSEKLDYKNNEPGAWKVTQNAKWISKDKTKLKIELDSVTTENSKNMDVVFVVDNSVNIAYTNKLNEFINAVNNTIDRVFLSQENKISLISFNDHYEILSDFTNNRNLLNNKINTLTSSGPSSYYQALVGVDKLLQDYEQSNDRKCSVVLLLGSSPSKDVPNEKAYYKYLKSKYSFITINAVQYGMSNSANNISDNILICYDNLSDALFQATEISETYSDFSLTNYFDSDYYKIESISSNEDNIKIDRDNNSFVWNIDTYRTGSKISLEIELLRVNYDSDYYTVNSKVEVKSKLGDIEESVITSDSSILKDKYQVSYDANLPSGCSSNDIPLTEIKNVFDTVEVSDVKLKCSGYQFKGWRLKTSSVENINDSYFIMPEDDVSFVAEWSKTALKKSVEGTIYVHVPPVLQSVSMTYNKEIWGYKSTITKIIIQDEISDIDGTVQSYDISDDKDGKVLGKIVSNGNSTYTAYIQGDGKIMANTNSYFLFYNFSNLTSIEGLDNLDTSNVVNMNSMFGECHSLINLNVSTFATSKVRSMAGMFGECHSLTNLNVSTFDTSKVTNMFSMFGNCNSLTSLDVSNFNTSNVTTMHSMFVDCDNLRNLNLGYFDTSKVTNTYNMFAECPYLITTITFRTNSVTDYTNMFGGAARVSGAKIIVNYTIASSSLVDKMIATKRSDGNVVKGSRVV